MDKSVLDIVASIENGDFEGAMTSILKTEPKKQPKVLAKAINLFNLKMFELQKKLDEANEQLAFHEQIEDTYANSFIDTICMSISDAHTALKASTLYNVDWFRSLEFSKPTKISFAQRLVDAVQVYNPTYPSSLWTNITKGVPAALNAITFSTDPRKIEEE